NVVEWGDGIFGAEAAARHYFGVGAGQLSPEQAARLAVMLPAPRRFEKNPYSDYLNRRTRQIAGRMHLSSVP
ncbi:MAG: transglycosylase domain-containing protein, partial [Rhodocyclaceae bacterium]